MKPQPSPANLLNEIGSRGGNVQQDHARGPGRKASGLEARKENMSSKHWLVFYGDRIPSEITPHAYSSVLEMLERAMTRFACGVPAAAARRQERRPRCRNAS